MTSPMTSSTMLPVASLPPESCSNLVGVMADIDDTITTDGHLPSSSYAMLERLLASDLLVILITGRPAGWCDMIARFFPVSGIVGENGALALRYDRQTKQMKRHYSCDESFRFESRSRLVSLSERILSDVPGCAVSSDQPYRECDLAIDFCEDVDPLPASAVSRIVRHFDEAGANSKVSSIHVNGWFGDWDKLTMTRRFVRDEFGLDIDSDNDRFVYCGDSPNDSPMFEFFVNSCGVSNVSDYVDIIDFLPRYVSSSRCSAGFLEIGERILSERN